MALVNAPLTWPKSVDSSRSAGIEPVFTGTNARSRRGRVHVDRFRDQLLAGSALALQQHRRAAGSHLRHQVEDAQHRLALADDVFEVVALLQRALELDDFFFSAAAADRGAHVGQQLLVVPGLLDEVGRARLHGVDGVLHRAIGGDHDDRQARSRARGCPAESRCHCARAERSRAAPGRRAARRCASALPCRRWRSRPRSLRISSRVCNDSRIAASSSMISTEPGDADSSRPAMARLTAASGIDCLSNHGKFHDECCALAGLAVDADLAGVFLNDAVGNGKAQPGSAAVPGLGLVLGGEERIVDAMECVPARCRCRCRRPSLARYVRSGC